MKTTPAHIEEGLQIFAAVPAEALPAGMAGRPISTPDDTSFPELIRGWFKAGRTSQAEHHVDCESRSQGLIEDCNCAVGADSTTSALFRYEEDAQLWAWVVSHGRDLLSAVLPLVHALQDGHEKIIGERLEGMSYHFDNHRQFVLENPQMNPALVEVYRADRDMLRRVVALLNPLCRDRE